MARYGPNEMLPKNICPYCRKRRKTRAGGGSSCSARSCIAAMNAASVGGGGERPQSADGETVWVKGVRGRSYKVITDREIRGEPCFKLKDKKTGDVIWRPIKDCEIR